MALCEALHHTAPAREARTQPQENRTQGRWAARRPEEARAAGGSGACSIPAHNGPSLATPSLADVAADVLDSSSLRFLTVAALAAIRKEEEKIQKEAKEQEKHHESQQQAARM